MAFSRNISHLREYYTTDLIYKEIRKKIARIYELYTVAIFIHTLQQISTVEQPTHWKLLTQTKFLTVEGGGDEKLIFMIWYRMPMFRQLSLSGWDSNSHFKKILNMCLYKGPQASYVASDPFWPVEI